MRIITIAGTRPELIRLSVLIKKLDNRADHTFVWTGQNYTRELKDIFFEELSIRAPDYAHDGAWAGLANQLGGIFELVERAIRETGPDKALILGDTNSALSTIVCERMGVPVYHMEAGNRCFDDKVPEEKNRKIIDHAATWSLPYTAGSRDNLIAEGIPRNRIHVCGNPIYEVMKQTLADQWNNPDYGTGHFLATFHRQENVDNERRLREILVSLETIASIFQTNVICSIHPRTRQRIAEFGLEQKVVKIGGRVQLLDPVGFRDFLRLEQGAICVLTDSGTVQEECCIFGVPTVTIRDSTERPETVECGSNIVSGLKSESIINCVVEMMKRDTDWKPPGGYLEPHVSEKVLEILDV